MKLAVFVSGQGTLLQKIIDCGKHEILYVCADKICPAIEKAIKAGITVAADQNMAGLPKPDLNVLAGFTSKIPLSPYIHKFINVHPSLLPAFGGKGMYGSKVFGEIKRSQVNFTGCTVHFCNDEYDEGPIILQKMVRIKPQWREEDIAAATHELELPCLLAAIKAIDQCNKIRMSGSHLDYVRSVHGLATEIDMNGEN